MCVLADTCIEGDVRLLTSDDFSDLTNVEDLRDDLERGRVEVCIDGRYGTVCDNEYWDNQDASVSCVTNWDSLLIGQYM